MTALRSIKEALRPRWLKVGRKWLASRRRLERLTRRYGLAPMSADPWSSLRRSDTLFILGSGASINGYTEREWTAIAAGDSVGFNNWALHPFIPSFFVTEPGKDLTQLRQEYANFERRGYGAVGVPILIKDGERYRYDEMCRVLDAMPPALLPQVRLSWDWEMQEERLPEFRRYLRLLERLDMISSARYPSLRKRASVINLAILALRAGYRQIVLCGIDLNGTSYFFADRRDALVAEGYWVPAPLPPAATHKTNDPAFGTITVVKALEVVNKEILVPHAVTLSVALKSSALHPALPSYFDQ